MKTYFLNICNLDILTCLVIIQVLLIVIGVGILVNHFVIQPIRVHLWCVRLQRKMDSDEEKRQKKVAAEIYRIIHTED